ncbi:unnamed protein product [Dracunculus medinensis]|uniref:ZP domain-containing protein n=1 Tax=Dracunculus medinensis TaxID=318479 RepID=A0A0N4UDD8_DRAME|nr:unnamed protein product [Dracunculus medinensis]
MDHRYHAEPVSLLPICYPLDNLVRLVNTRCNYLSFSCLALAVNKQIATMVFRLTGWTSVLQLSIAYLMLQGGSLANYENGLIGSPEIQCNSDAIQMAFRTKHPFKDCKVDYSRTNQDGQPIGGIKLSHGQCDMDRQRTIQPEGMQFSTILIISFHPVTLFITKIDRAFHIKCMYQEYSRTVKSGIEVSSIPTQILNNEFPMPKCTYTIRKDEIDGPILKYARVGDQIVHRWECESDLYGLLVHNCYVEDGQGERQLIIDGKGCHTDHMLLGDPTYIETLSMAYRESLVFKFADRIVVRFQCEIKLCLKENSGCSGITVCFFSPPICMNFNEPYKSEGTTEFDNLRNAPNIYINASNEENPRFPRSVNLSRLKATADTDLISQSVYVFDNEDINDQTIEDVALHLNPSLEKDVCISSAIFIILLTMLSILFIILSTVALWIAVNCIR